MSNLDKKYTIKLDTKNSYFNTVPTFSLSDNETSDFNIMITNRNSTMNLQNVIVVMVAINPNNEMYSDFIEVENEEEGLLYCNLKQAFKNITGTWNARLMLIYEDEKVVTGTFSYRVNTDEFVTLNEKVVTDDRFPLLNDALSRLSSVEITEEQRQINEAQRILQEEINKTNETNRIENELVREHQGADREKAEAVREEQEHNRAVQENKRASVETNRIEAELARTANEDMRISNENQRITNYNFMTKDEVRRKLDEEVRIANEKTRELEETSRTNEETRRRTVEQLRTLNEDTRITSEGLRVAKENVRLGNEDKRIANETNRNQAESSRQINETNRIEAENNRKIEFQEKVSTFLTYENTINTLGIDFDNTVANVTNGNESATNTEIVLARKGETSLRKKMDKIDEQFISIKSEKATKIEVEVERQRINQMHVIPEGGTTSDVALNDIKVGYNGKVWDSPSVAVRGQVLELKNDLEEVCEGLQINWNIGNIDGLGTITNGATTKSNYYSDLISKEKFENIIMYSSIGSGRTFSYCIYDEKGVFISRQPWLKSTQYVTEDAIYNIDNSYSIRLLIALYYDDVNTTHSVNDILSNINITLTEKHSNIDNLNKRIMQIENNYDAFDFLKTVDRNIHLSIDDVAYSLYQLQTEQPNSIYDIELFSYIKTLHDTYGICVTCNTFNYLSTIPDYDISKVPNKWLLEFQEAKDWLRFAFHAKDDTSYTGNLTTSDIDYKKFVDAVLYFTGTYKCIDTITRLGFFHGNKTEVIKMKTSDNGIIGLLCADSLTRSSYYLDDDKNREMQTKGIIYDLENELYFIRSLTRLDSADENAIKSYMLGDNRKNKLVEIFFHESLSSSVISVGNKTRIKGVLDMLILNRGYGSNFVMDLLA